jgi:cardiolipin synthase (CMP-forming)
MPGKRWAVIDNRKIVRNIPNALSFYRLLMAPVISVLALAGYERLFVVLIVVSLATDILDGLIARTFHLQTAFGAKLDSIADDATYFAAFVGIFAFKRYDIGVHLPLLYVFITLLVLTSLVHLIKFHRFPSFHLYSFKIGGYLQGGFLAVLFLFGFQVELYYAAFGFGILACIEVIALTLIVDEPISNARGLYWLLRDRHRGLAMPR